MPLSGGTTFANLTVLAGGALDLYNAGGPGSADFERLRADWSSNIARLWTQNDGTGSGRALQVGVASADGATAPIFYTQYAASASPFIRHTFVSNGTTGAQHELASTGNLIATAGTQTAVAISPTFAQTSTAAGIALLVNPSGTSGSGGLLLQSWQQASVQRAYLSSAGALNVSNLVSSLNLSLEASLGAGADVSLTRDAADTLALRRSTNAQTFRVYNTYTDASNNERMDIGWSANFMFLRTNASGTGTNRGLVIGTSGNEQLYLQTNATTRWQVNTPGHLMAGADNTYDIGASGATRPRDCFLAGSVVTGSRVFTGSFTVATLPTAATSTRAHAFVTDSSVVAAGNFGNVVAGSGANIVPVYSDGTNWRIG